MSGGGGVEYPSLSVCTRMCMVNPLCHYAPTVELVDNRNPLCHYAPTVELVDNRNVIVTPV